MVVMPFGTYILGGEDNSGNSEFLKTGRYSWQAGPTIPSPGLAFGCAVAIDFFRFVVIGGYPDGHSGPVANVRMYDMASGSWTEWSALNTPVYFVACAKLGSTIVVGGGYNHNDGGPQCYYSHKTNSSTGDLSETSIIDIRDGSNIVAAPFNTLRHGALMIGLHGIVVAFGGWSTENSAALTSLEIWNPNGQTWIDRPSDVFQTGRQKFGMVTLSFPPGTCELSVVVNESTNGAYADWASSILDNVIN